MLVLSYSEISHVKLSLKNKAVHNDFFSFKHGNQHTNDSPEREIKKKQTKHLSFPSRPEPDLFICIFVVKSAVTRKQTHKQINNLVN